MNNVVLFMLLSLFGRSFVNDAPTMCLTLRALIKLLSGIVGSNLDT